MMNQQSKIESIISIVKYELQNAEGGHDWFHIERVWRNAKLIAQTENANLFVVELAALLHDIADSKFNNGDEDIGPRKAREILVINKVPEDIIDHVVAIIQNISFKGGKTNRTFNSIELQIVQDADRLDAIGAIGIARAFNYGGYKNRALFNPSILPNLNQSKEEYKNSSAPTINHFYEKLLLLKELMNTTTGKQLAQQRHQFMESYLEQFYSEWNGNA
jgi:uncharacterized protein